MCFSEESNDHQVLADGLVRHDMCGTSQEESLAGKCLLEEPHDHLTLQCRRGNNNPSQEAQPGNSVEFSPRGLDFLVMGFKRRSQGQSGPSAFLPHRAGFQARAGKESVMIQSKTKSWACGSRAGVRGDCAGPCCRYAGPARTEGRKGAREEGKGLVFSGAVSYCSRKPQKMILAKNPTICSREHRRIWHALGR